jgi:hypothetical protein
MDKLHPGKSSGGIFRLPVFRGYTGENYLDAKVGDRLPRETLSTPTGPRAAIEARGAWERGRWTVELKRALETGSADDVRLTGPGPFPFAVSIHDDAQKDEHAQMGRDVLLLRLP